MMSLYHILVILFLHLAVATDETPSYQTHCVQLNGTVSLNITYEGSDEVNTNNFVIEISKNANVSGTCGKKTSSLTLSENGRDLVIEFSVNTNKTNKDSNIAPNHWGVTSVKYSYEVQKVDALNKGERNATAVGAFFVSPVNMSYSCSKEMVELVNVTRLDDKKITDAKMETVTLNGTRLTIRVGDMSRSASDPYDFHYCKIDQKIKDIVPIAVGIALAALVIIVLVSYLIGRRRSVSAGGYERV